MEREETLKNKQTLSLKLKGNIVLLIWIGYDGTVGENRVKDPTHIWMRIDKYQQYWVTFDKGYEYLKGEIPILEKLKDFGFKSSIENMKKILDITKDLEISTQLRW